jgi:hypothetical protein
MIAGPVPAAAISDRQALGYIDRADTAGTCRVYAADWRHSSVWCLGRASCRYRRHLPASPRMPRRRSTGGPSLSFGTQVRWLKRQGSQGLGQPRLTSDKRGS